MTIQFPFELIYASPVKQHLQAIDRKYWSLIYSTIEAQLQFEPQVETRNRKPLKVPLAFGGEWEIRFGPDNRFRVFYEIDEEHRIVQILAIGVKQGNQLFIGGKEIKS